MTAAKRYPGFVSEVTSPSDCGGQTCVGRLLGNDPETRFRSLFLVYSAKRYFSFVSEVTYQGDCRGHSYVERLLGIGSEIRSRLLFYTTAAKRYLSNGSEVNSTLRAVSYRRTAFFSLTDLPVICLRLIYGSVYSVSNR